MEPRIFAIADELPAELVDRYARTLPLSVICELLGLPLEDRLKFTAWASGFTRLTSTISLLSLVPNILAMRRYLEKQLEAVRENGGTGLIAELVRVEKEGGQISRDEMVAMVFLLLFAGHETTTHLISGSAYELLRNPGLRDWLGEDWSRAGLAVEEFLRFISVVQFTKPRFVRKDTELGGVRLSKGDKIMPMLVAANFDPRQIHMRKEFIFASAISLRASRHMRTEGFVPAGRNSLWRWMNPRSRGAGAPARSSICRSLSRCRGSVDLDARIAALTE
jgi:cytochrome P450 PksS